jgi:hypothetical protein
MNFDKFIKKQFTILEQDQSGQNSAPYQNDAVMPDVDQESKKMTSQIENIESEVLQLVNKLISLLRDEETAKRIHLTPEISSLLDELQGYSTTPNPSAGLDNIEKAVKDAKEDYIRKPM